MLCSISKGFGGLDFYIGFILYVMTMNDLYSSDLTDSVTVKSVSFTMNI